VLYEWYMRKGKNNMCFVSVTWGRKIVICVLCMLHEEGKIISFRICNLGKEKSNTLCVCYIRKAKSNVLCVCYMKQTKVMCVLCMLHKEGKK
jgi:hypothetical protein